MKKCYIAGYIGDLPVEQYIENFRKAEKEVIKLGMEPVSPLKLDHNHDKKWKSYMVTDLIAMLQCDCVYVQENFRFSPGAKIEVELASKIGIDIIYQK